MATLIKCVLIKDFRSPSIQKPNRGEKVRYRDFREGQIVTGYIRDTSNSRIKLAPQIVAFEKWAIPFSHLNKVGNTNKHIKDIDTMNFFGDLEEPDFQKNISDIPVNNQANAFDDGYVLKGAPLNTNQPKDAVQQMESNVNQIKNSDLLKSVVNKSKMSSNGIMIGGVIGVAVGYYYNKNIIVSAILGGIGGGYVGSMWAKYKN